jgi:DNA-binding response OmpR family regulator
MSNILVIDDEKMLLNMFIQALTRFGYNVETATNGKEGVQKFDRGHFDLVITDLLMGGMDGNCVLQHIRNSDRHLVPVMGVSGTPWLLDEKNFDAVLTKPFSIKALLNTVESLTVKTAKQSQELTG